MAKYAVPVCVFFFNYYYFILFFFKKNTMVELPWYSCTVQLYK
eukprot:SAG11_NODE_194_length_12858_cov_28.436946_7_plen_43_part_00